MPLVQSRDGNHAEGLRGQVTKASSARLERRQKRKRGRPSLDDDAVINLAAAFRIAWKLSARGANDLAVSWLEAREVEPSKPPRGSKRRDPSSILVGYEHRFRTSFSGRDATLRQKQSRGDATPHPGVVLALTFILLSPEMATARRCARHILSLPEDEAQREALRILNSGM